MKKFNHFSIIMLALLMACSLIDGSDDDDDKKDSELACRFASWFFTSTWDDGDGYTGSMQETTTVTYAANLVDNILVNSTEEDCYLSDCDTYTEEAQLVFSYASNMMTGIMMYVDGNLVSDGSDLTFENGRLTKVTELDEGDLDEYRFTYDGDGRLIKEENWDNYSGPNPGELTLYSYTDFVYSGGNMASSTTYYNDIEVGRFEAKKSRMESSRINSFAAARPDAFVVVAESTYTYDDKNNPFSDNYALYFMDLPASFAFSDNNVLSETATYTFGDTPETYTMNFVFTYNDEDYPLQLLLELDNETTNVSFTYNCE